MSSSSSGTGLIIEVKPASLAQLGEAIHAVETGCIGHSCAECPEPTVVVDVNDAVSDVSAYLALVLGKALDIDAAEATGLLAEGLHFRCRRNEPANHLIDECEIEQAQQRFAGDATKLIEWLRHNEITTGA